MRRRPNYPAVRLILLTALQRVRNTADPEARQGYKYFQGFLWDVVDGGRYAISYRRLHRVIDETPDFIDGFDVLDLGRSASIAKDTATRFGTELHTLLPEHQHDTKDKWEEQSNAA